MSAPGPSPRVGGEGERHWCPACQDRLDRGREADRQYAERQDQAALQAARDAVVAAAKDWEQATANRFEAFDQLRDATRLLLALERPEKHGEEGK